MNIPKATSAPRSWRPFLIAAALTLAAATVIYARTAREEPPVPPRAQDLEPPWLRDLRPVADRIIREATGSSFAWQRVAEMTDTFGHRLSGSLALEQAILWAEDQMKRDGLENVHREPVMVPRWVRGQESAEIVAPNRHLIVMLGLGGSIATPPDGIETETVVVHSFSELDSKADSVRGKIVVYNVPFTTYGETVQYRSNGASHAARHGAVAILLRSVGPAGLRTPHTGALRYAPNAPQIPAAAITVEDAERLQRMQDRGQKPIVRLMMEARTLPDVESANLVGEIRGRELPNEVVVVGGHIDSWDVGSGAMDDAGGCVVMWEALRLMRKLNLRPRRTVRLVLWTNEENGLRGGVAYRDRHVDELRDHVLMIESDSGVFRPVGFGFTGPEAARTTVTAIARLLRPIGADQIGPNGGGADIGPSVEAGRLPAMSLEVDGSQYFIYHHTPADTIDRLNPSDVARCAAAVAVMTYAVAEMPIRLGS